MIENLLRPLQQWQVTVNLAGNRQQVVPVRQMGISHAMLLTSLSSQKLWYPNGLPSNFTPGGMEGPGAGMGPRGFAGVAPGMGNPNRPQRQTKTPMGPGGVVDPLNERKAENIWQTDFEIVFVWKETPAAVRLAAEPPPPTAEGATDPAAPGATPVPGAPPVPGAVPTGAAPVATPGIAPPGGAPAGAPGVAPTNVPPGTPPAAGN